VEVSRALIVRGDITTLAVDAIVNAANESLLGGGGVDGAIHDAAGPELLEACRRLGGCEPGEAKLTPGFVLPARWVIHTVGPRWQGGAAGEEEVLRRCYRSAIAIARERGLRSLAFPSISTGAFGYPLDLAAPVALEEIGRGLAGGPGLAITVVCFDAATHGRYSSLAT
jgi:O-acetyl-ADP-ribose deacetylase (regulator of RNase III)